MVKYYIDDVRVIDRASAKVKLTDKSGSSIDGAVKLVIGDESFDIDVVNGEANLIIGRLKAGNYTYSATFNGNEEYSKASVYSTFEVRDSLLNVIFTVKNVTKYYGGSENLSVNVKTTNNKPVADINVYVEINGKEYVLKTDKDGNAKLAIPLNSAPL